MFYFHEILKKKGKFGIIWLAATAPKRINRRDIYGVDVVRSSNDVIEILTQYPSMAGRRKVRFSLYLSSQLMFGLTSVNNIKSSILLDELRTLAARMRSFRSEPSSAIDLEEPITGIRVTFDEPDFENAPIDFGTFHLMDESSISLPTYDYFIVATPHSTPQSSGASEERARAADIRVTFDEPGFENVPVDFDVRDEHTVRPEEITMQEEALIPQQIQVPTVDDAPEDLGIADFTEPLLLPETNVVDVLQSLVDRVLEREPVVAVAEPEVPSENGIDVAVPERDGIAAIQPSPTQPEPEAELPVEEQEAQDLRLPQVPVVGPDAAAPGGEDDERPRQRYHTLSPSPSPEPDQRPMRRDSSVSDVAFVLPPAPTGDRRRRRRRRLVIDTGIQIPYDVQLRNMQRVDEHTRPLILPSRQETAESMLSRFGLRTAAHGSKRLWPNPRTLPEPNDPARFGFFGEPTAATSDVLAEDTVLPDVSMDGLRGVSREEARAEDTREESRDVTQADLSGLPSRVSHTSRILHESRDRDQLSPTRISRMSSFQGGADLSVPDLPGIRPEFDEYGDMQPEPEPLIEPQFSVPVTQRDIEPDGRSELLHEPEAESIPVSQRVTELVQETELPAEPEEMQDVPTRRRRESCVIIVSPEKTPPPPSPSLPRSPILDRAMWYIEQAINESTEPGVTTFTSVLSRTPGTRTYVGKMFSFLLTLHEYRAIIVEQEFPFGEIFIFRGPRFDEYSPE